MTVQPTRSSSPAQAENLPAEVAREIAAAEAALASLTLIPGPGRLAGREPVLAESVFGRDAAVSGAVLSLWGAQLVESIPNIELEGAGAMFVGGPVDDTSAADKATRQRMYNERLQAWETAHGACIPEMRGLDVDVKQLSLNLLGLQERGAPVPPGVFSCLSKLESLSVSWGGALIDLADHPSLKALELGYVRDFPSWVRRCRGLERLRVREALDLPEWLGELSGLKELLISGNVSHLPLSLGGLSQLETLAVHCSLIEELPEELSECRALRSLNLNSCNSLQRLPRGLFGLPLESLCLDFCSQLQAVPEDIERCQSLQHIRFAMLKSLQHPPEGLGRLANLKTLGFYQNNHQRLPASVFSLPQLQRLVCLREEVEALPLQDCLFEGLSVSERGELLGAHARLLEMLKESDEQERYHDLLDYTDVIDDSGELSRVIGLRSRFAGLIGQRLLERRRADLEAELRSLAVLHAILEARLGDLNLAPHAERSWLHAALGAAVLPDTALRIRATERLLRSKQP